MPVTKDHRNVSQVVTMNNKCTSKNGQDGVMTNGLQTAVRKYDDVEENGHQAQ